MFKYEKVNQVCMFVSVHCGIPRSVAAVRLSSVMVEECRAEGQTSFNSSPAPTAQSRNVRGAGRDTVRPPGMFNMPGLPQATHATHPKKKTRSLHRLSGKRKSSHVVRTRMRVKVAAHTVVVHPAVKNLRPRLCLLSTQN